MMADVKVDDELKAGTRGHANRRLRRAQKEMMC